MSITRGRIKQPNFITIYGQDGVGKTSFAAGAPNILFLDAEKGTLHMDVTREEITSYASLTEALDRIIAGHADYKNFQSVAFDSLDWLVPKVYEHVCATVKHEKGHAVESIEGYGFGKGYVHAREVWQKLIAKCQQVRDRGINVILLAHAQVFTIDSPDTTGAYKQYDLKLPRTSNNDIAALFREACDTVGFISWKRLTPKDDPRAIDGGRVLRTQQSPGWAAKNRFGLPDEITLPEFKRDAAGIVIPDQERLLWAAYTGAVDAAQVSGPNLAGILKLAEQVPDGALREIIKSAVNKDAKDSVKLAKHLERIKAIVSKGTDTQPVAQATPSSKPPKEEI